MYFNLVKLIMGLGCMDGFSKPLESVGQSRTGANTLKIRAVVVVLGADVLVQRLGLQNW